MGRLRPPDYLPRELLGRSDFARACETRDLGAIFRIAIKWGGPGFSPSHLARRCEMSVGRINDYMKELKHAQSVEVFERVSDSLHIPGAMLGISRREWEEPGDLTAQREDTRSVTSQRNWLRTRHLLNRYRTELTQVAQDLYPESVHVGRTGFLMPPAWRLGTPVDLASVDVELAHPPEPLVTGRSLRMGNCKRSGRCGSGLSKWAKSHTQASSALRSACTQSPRIVNIHRTCGFVLLR
jgi:hypothetical protein